MSAPASTACIVGQERGQRCLPVVPGSPYCDNHNPDRRERRLEITRKAARRSHEGRQPAPLDLPPEGMTPDYSTPASRTRYREVVASARAHGKLDDKAAATLLAAVDGAMKDQPKAPARLVPAVDVWRSGTAGQAEPAA
jgi:hypothetical protein